MNNDEQMVDTVGDFLAEFHHAEEDSRLELTRRVAAETAQAPVDLLLSALNRLL